MQVTVRREVLEHLEIRPGDKIEVEKLPGGRVSLGAVQPSGSIKDLFGFLAGKTDKVATLEEIDEAIAAGWAGAA